MISLLKNNTPFALLILICLAAIPQFLQLQPAKPLDAIMGPTAMQDVANRLIILFGGNNSTMSNFWSIIVLLAEALLFNRIITNQKFADRLGMIPAASFLLLNLLLPAKSSGLMVLITGLIIIVLQKLIILYKHSTPNNTLIIAGFFSGLIAAFGTPFLILFFWLIAALLIMRPASFRECMLLSAGFILPFYFIGSGLYLSNQLKIESLLSYYQINFSPPVVNKVELMKISIFVGLPWVGLFASRNVFNKMMIQNRKTYLIMLILYLTVMLMCVCTLSKSTHLLGLLLIPASVMITPMFSSSKKQFVPNLIFWSMVLISFMR